MTAGESPAFGVLLTRFRLAAGLTQEELAERAGLSARGISDLERGLRVRPQALTIQRLVEALRLSPEDRLLFEEASRAPAGLSSAGPGPLIGHFLGAQPSSVLVARTEEVARIQAVLETVAAGTGQVLVLAGELGMGKTRLAQEIVLMAQATGFIVGTGTCYQGEQQRPGAAFLEALGGLAAGAPGVVHVEAQRRRQALQRLLREEIAVTGTGLDPQVVAAVAGLVLLLAERGPVALLLDDLHWADDGTVILLHALARATRGAPVLLVGTLRDGRVSEEHPVLARTLHDLSRERLLERIGVRRLVPEETAALVAALMEQPEVSEEVAGFIHRRSKGTPRFVEQIVRSLGGRLQLRREIGAGAMGRVFEAVDARTGSTVAAKLMFARGETELEAVLRFQQEGSVLAALSHPHIVRIYDTFVEEHASCIIMERLDGSSLGQLLRDGPLPLPRAKRLAVQVAAALAYAHAQGIVHRDIKPDNVMVVGDDQVKVTDFGIARLLRPDTSLQTIATTGMRLGTPLYMAPEQIEGKTVDGRTDIYAFGALLYHMVTGQPPFSGGDALAIAIKHLQEDPLPPRALNPAVPAAWDVVILRALEKDPAQRFPSAQDMERAIAALEVPTGAAVPASQRTRTPGAVQGLPRLWTRPQRRAALAGLAVLLVAAAIAVRGLSATTARSPSLGARINAYLSGLAAKHLLSGTVLVARQGTVVLDKGYGLANPTTGVPNTAATTYPAGTVGATFSVVSLLQGSDFGSGSAGLQRPICAYLPHCPASWRPITVRMVVEGTSHLPDYNWGQPGNTPQQSLAACQAEPVTGYPPSTDNDCESIVLATILERRTHMSWGQALTDAIFRPSGMVHSGWMIDDLAASAGFADDYNGVPSGPSHVYNDFFAPYSTASDLYAYDNALFGGKLLSAANTAAMLTPRNPVIPPDPDVTNLRWADYWRIGTFFGQRVAYTVGDARNYLTVNMRFPDAGVTVIVLSNNRQNDLVGVALHAAALVFGRHLAPPPPIQKVAPPALVGTYQRTFHNADRRAAHDPGLTDWVGVTQYITFRRGWFDYGTPGSPPANEEYYTATRDGRLTLLGFPQGTGSSFCSLLPTETPPTGHYRWARQGKYLIITRMAFDTCLDRGALMAGRWTKVG